MFEAGCGEQAANKGVKKTLQEKQSAATRNDSARLYLVKFVIDTTTINALRQQRSKRFPRYFIRRQVGATLNVNVINWCRRILD